MKLNDRTVLVTGGMGFIGSFMVDRLVESGARVIIYDNLDPQVHPAGVPPDYQNKEAEFINGDVRNRDELKKAVARSSWIVHLAAAVGVGQSQYKIHHYCDVNVGGTSMLMDILANDKHSVEKILIAASMSSYGEGVYNCPECGDVRPPLRGEEQMKRRDWELHCPECNNPLEKKHTPEKEKQNCNSIYAITKKAQEEIVLNIGRTYNIPAVAPRYFNIYGPRQSLSNPYTGVVAIFMSRIKNNNPPVIFEDGKQTRDFISIHDIVEVNMRLLTSNVLDYHSVNVGRGEAIEIAEVAKKLATIYGKDIKPDILESFRKGDVRHCYADISLLENKLGYTPRVSFEDGMKELVEWSETVRAEDKLDKSLKELKEKNII